VGVAVHVTVVPAGWGAAIFVLNDTAETVALGEVVGGGGDVEVVGGGVVVVPGVLVVEMG
jgi:hypothetical protein